jgi:hypothetical protein
LLKLQDVGSGADVISFFVTGGEELQTDAPLGSFTLKYANGGFWCGNADLFGPDTTVSEAAHPIVFRPNYSKTIELIPQIGGNLETYRIPRSQF